MLKDVYNGLARKKLTEWLDEYPEPWEGESRDIWRSFAEMDRRTMAMTYYQPKAVGRELRPLIAFNIDWLDKRHMPMFCFESILWHEYCHAQAFIEDQKGNGHDDHWRRLRSRKPIYVVGECLAKLLWGL